MAVKNTQNEFYLLQINVNQWNQRTVIVNMIKGICEIANLMFTIAKHSTIDEYIAHENIVGII